MAKRNRRTAEPATPVVPITVCMREAQEQLLKLEEVTIPKEVSLLSRAVNAAFAILDTYGYNLVADEVVDALHSPDYSRRMFGIRAVNESIRAHNAWVDSERAAQAEEERQRALQDAKAQAILERGRLTGDARPAWLDAPPPVRHRPHQAVS